MQQVTQIVGSWGASVSLVVKTFVNWGGRPAKVTFCRLASLLAASHRVCIAT